MSVKAYKGFNKNMTCRGFEFKEGNTYEEDEAKLCQSGFHACEHPLGCFGYYPPVSSVYHEVELDDLDSNTEEDTKRAGKKITIGARIDIAGMVKAAINFVFAKADWSNVVKHATGYQGAASATGDLGAASATGRWGAASATGYLGAASATGYQGVACALGINGKAKAKIGGWIICAEWKETEPSKWERADVRCAKVDGENIKDDTWYTLRNGKFVEAGE